MDIGKLRSRIVIQRCEEIEDANGVNKSVWKNYKTIWCQAVDKNLKTDWEKWTVEKYEAKNIIDFTIRYNSCPDLKVTDRILFRGVVYNIKNIDNIFYKNEMLKITALAVM